MIPSRRLLAAITALVLFVATPAFAQWVVAQVSQPAHHAVDGRSWRPLTVGMEVPNHAWIHTGRTGRLLLRQAGEIIQFKPNTVAAVSRRIEGSGEATTILQKFGSILIDVEPHQDRTRAVETPYLAAIVKGTRFEVVVGRTSVEMRVHAGIVEATHPTRGERALVHAGQVALAHGHRRFAVRGGGPEPVIVTVEPREPRVSPARPAREPPRTPAPHSDDDSGGWQTHLDEQRKKGPASREKEPGDRKKDRRTEKDEPEPPETGDGETTGDGDTTDDAGDDPDTGSGDQVDEQPDTDVPDDTEEDNDNPDSDVDEAGVPAGFTSGASHLG